MDYKFRVDFLEEAKDFLDHLDEKSRAKIIYNIWKSRSTNDKELFKKLQDEIWEFRTKYNKSYYRLFAFWDKNWQRGYDCNFNSWFDKESRQNTKR